ncbi:Aldo/keto reductase [Agrocybe pediades]|nr:Aldo/keto reductase [Agrocybe pediades]
MAAIQYRQLGKSGLRVSVPVLGAMGFGSSKWLPWIVDEEKGLEILKAAWDAGINTIDTANGYSNGESERVIGEFMTKHNIPRENMVIMTKAFMLVSPEDISKFTLLDPTLPNTRRFVNQGGLSRISLFHQVDASLKRLQTSYIDLLQIHAFDPTTPMEETMKALHDLVISGKVLYIGACNLKAWHFVEMNNIAERHGWTQFVSMQLDHSLLYRPEERELFDYCKAKGIGILAYSPLKTGALARPSGSKTTRTKSQEGTPYEMKLRESDHIIINRVEELAGKHGCSMSQIALAWSARKTTSPIVGINAVERVTPSLIDDSILSEEEIKYLEEPYEYTPHRM